MVDGFGSDPVELPDVAAQSVRELLDELTGLQDQITRTSARAGYSSPPPPHEPVPDRRLGVTRGDRGDPPGLDAPDNPSRPDEGGGMGVLGALDLLEALERRERAVLAELHRRSTPETGSP